MIRRILKGARLICHPVYRRGLMQGVGAAIEHANVISQLDLSCVIDVGANRGQFSLLARRYFPEAEIHAIEPIPEEADRYRRLFSHDGRVELHELAVGSGKLLAQINIARRKDSSSLLAFTPNQTRAFPGTDHRSTLSVRVERLDAILDRWQPSAPCLLKIDVQGYELEVLRGLGTKLPSIDYIYCELSFQRFYEGQPTAAEIIEWLAARSFKLRCVNNLTMDSGGQPAQADVLFCRSSDGHKDDHKGPALC